MTRRRPVPREREPDTDDDKLARAEALVAQARALLDQAQRLAGELTTNRTDEQRSHIWI